MFYRDMRVVKRALQAAGYGVAYSCSAGRQGYYLGHPLGEVYLHTPEDLIIYKLWYYSLSQQTKHLRDITSIVQLVGESLDFSYLYSWIEQKGMAGLWESLLANI
jgi:hypothetical protein